MTQLQTEHGVEVPRLPAQEPNAMPDPDYGELVRRMAELEAERTARIAFAALLMSGLAGLVVLLIFVVAL